MFGFGETYNGMTAATLESRYHVNPEQLVFVPHYSGTCEIADIPDSPYAVWRESDRYMVTENNSVCKFSHDLSRFL